MTDVRVTKDEQLGSDPVSALGEHALLERIRARMPVAPPFVIVGIGDDAAVVEPERNALEVFTTDSLVEGVHFDQAFVGPADIGHKALAVNLSDVAAMGAAPRVALLSLVLPPSWPVAHVDSLVDSMVALATRSKVSIVGGNIARYINHSCRPNCYVDIKDGTIWIRAARTVRKGEEITYHYNTDGEGLIMCKCRPGCQTLL